MEECGRNKLRPSRFGCVRVSCLMSARRFPPRQRRISAQAADAALQISIGHLALMSPVEPKSYVLRLTSFPQLMAIPAQRQRARCALAALGNELFLLVKM